MPFCQAFCLGAKGVGEVTLPHIDFQSTSPSCHPEFLRSSAGHTYTSEAEAPSLHIIVVGFPFFQISPLL